MFNEYLANEEAKLYIQRRSQEANEYRLRQRLGLGDHDRQLTGWMIRLFIILALVVLLGLWL